ncbi:pseudaminic acid cytidylyltransferase [Ekhidna sp.]|uniref:pseudaminic acid cytidylyltransferase n=1 Tax=Ekhidna sp. TaxID=2608089 RepID=UPI003299C0C8
MANLCIIPARGGSKRIPNKNIKNFLGKPIIAYSIETALKSGLFDEVMVSTDSAEIADVSREFGAIVPFNRSGKNSDDYATTSDVILEVIESYKAKLSREFEYVCCIYPTAPFISVENLTKAYDLMCLEKRSTVFPTVRYAYPIQRSLKWSDKLGNIEFVWPEYAQTRSQDLDERYHDAGQFYWINVDKFKSQPTLISENTSSILMKEIEVQDIDNISDWKIAELKYEALRSS